MVEIKPIREIVSRYHNSKISEKVAEAFGNRMRLEYPESIWSRVVSVLKSNRYYTLGLSGELLLDWDTISAYFPNVIITNQLTNPNVYSVRIDIQGDISILAIGQNSSFYTGLGNILGIEEMSDRSTPLFGINIRFRKNKKLISSKGKQDCESELLLHGNIYSGFLLSHKGVKVYSLNNLIKFLH